MEDFKNLFTIQSTKISKINVTYYTLDLPDFFVITKTMKKLLTILCLVLLSSYSYSKEVIPEGETGSRKGPPKAGTVTKKGPEREFETGPNKFGPQRVYITVRESNYNKRPYEKFYVNGQLEQRGN